MGAAYSVELDLNINDEDTLFKDMMKFIKENYYDKVWRDCAGKDELENIDDCIRVIFRGDFNKSDGVYFGDFDATYSYEGLLRDCFAKMCKSLNNGSKMTVCPDNDVYELYAIDGKMRESKGKVYAGESVTIEEIRGHYDEYVAEVQDWLWDAFRDINDGYAVLQMKETDDYNGKFSSYDMNIQHGFKISADNYNIFWAEEKLMGEPEKEINKIYRIFNAPDRPNLDDGYYGTSLSVSDVILTKSDGAVRAFYVDDIGFKELDGQFFNERNTKGMEKE